MLEPPKALIRYSAQCGLKGKDAQIATALRDNSGQGDLMPKSALGPGDVGRKPLTLRSGPSWLLFRITACISQITALRQRGMAELSASQLEQLFALGFVLEQLQRNIKDLERCIQEWVSSAQDPAKK